MKHRVITLANITPPVFPVPSSLREMMSRGKMIRTLFWRASVPAS